MPVLKRFISQLSVLPTLVILLALLLVVWLEDGRAHPYVAARIMMNNEQWGQYLWISHHGSLAGYRKNGEG